jgi:16S rRNA (cytosine967-C5)-methyltransferase
MAANVRALAAKCCFAVVDKGRSLGDELPKLQAKVEGKDKGLLQELCYGVLRYLPALEHDLRKFMDKPLKGKQRVGHFLVLVGIYQIVHTRIPDHAAVSETVAATKPLKNDHLKGLINGVLRNYQRSIEKDNKPIEALPDAIKFSHPSWFIKKLQSAYPRQWQDILQANLERPPMWLRVNKQHHTTEQYIALLDETEIEYDTIDQVTGAIKLSQAVDVNKLPGFSEGWSSIQDGAAQQAAALLNSQSGDNVLDCCAAPGGKTCHILEYTPNVAAVTAIDIEADRLVRVQENLTRLNLSANVITADAADTENPWWDGQLFDRILLDAPCSGTGVIRRHPDIKWLRKASDIESLTVLQQKILKNIWSLLKPGGTLLYATCSILPEENYQQIQQFVSENSNAKLIDITKNSTDIGWQILPNEQSMDGFYYAKLEKTIN